MSTGTAGITDTVEAPGSIAGGTGGGLLPALLLLADGRLPAGGHAHSGGLEAAAGAGSVFDVATTEAFLRGRLDTIGLVAAAFAAAACAACSDGGPDGGSGDSETVPVAIERLEGELDARTPSPALRAASRRLGRQLLRAGRAIWPHPVLDAMAAAPGRGPHQAVAFGAVAAAAGLGAEAAAVVAAHDTVAGPAAAAVRLLGLDPLAVHNSLARLGPQIAAVAADGACHAHTPPADLPARAAPALDVGAERHASWEVRLFAS